MSDNVTPGYTAFHDQLDAALDQAAERVATVTEDDGTLEHYPVTPQVAMMFDRMSADQAVVGDAGVSTVCAHVRLDTPMILHWLAGFPWRLLCDSCAASIAPIAGTGEVFHGDPRCDSCGYIGPCAYPSIALPPAPDSEVQSPVIVSAALCRECLTGEPVDQGT